MSVDDGSTKYVSLEGCFTSRNCSLRQIRSCLLKIDSKFSICAKIGALMIEWEGEERR